MFKNDDAHIAKCVSSALWAAYGDALGFPTELAGPQLVQRRLGRASSTFTQSWKKQLEGAFGAEVDMLAGAYSDDTQLRLATCRAITADFFDVESFAKIELPVWLSYSLGAGVGSKKAANSLASKKINWFSNFYSSYVLGGGNGAAMRIQPHVWSSSNLHVMSSYLPDVVRNAICTHGHLRGIVGAVIHAYSLAYVFLHNDIPSPYVWEGFAKLTEETVNIILEDETLSTFWLPAWEKQSKQSIHDAAYEVINEWVCSVHKAQSLLIGAEPHKSYIRIVQELGGTSKAERGSGLKTALFAMVAAWLFKDSFIEEGLIAVANLLNSDTDSIASMCGALLGAFKYDKLPCYPIQDRDYIKASAERMAYIALKKPVQNFVYPDLFDWQLPTGTPMNFIGQGGDNIVLLGLGTLNSISGLYESKNKEIGWQWFETDFGQTVLCKRRKILGKISKKMLPKNQFINSPVKVNNDVANMSLWEQRKIEDNSNYQETLFNVVQKKNDSIGIKEADSLTEALTLDSLTNKAIQSGFSPELIGQHLLMLSERECGIEKVVAYSAIIAKAWSARAKKNRI